METGQPLNSRIFGNPRSCGGVVVVTLIEIMVLKDVRKIEGLLI